MKIDIEFKGLEELVKAFESAASDEDIAQVNKTIAEKGEPVVQRIMSGKIPKSKGHQKKWARVRFKIISVRTCSR